MDALWRDLKQDGVLGTELQSDGVLGCPDENLDFAPVRGRIECVTVAHGIADGFGQGVGEKEEVNVLALDAPKVGYVFAGDQGWVGNTETPIAMNVGQGQQGGKGIVVVGVSMAAGFPWGTVQADGQALAAQAEQMTERIQ